jgi:hypothetical protein
VENVLFAVLYKDVHHLALVFNKNIIILFMAIARHQLDVDEVGGACGTNGGEKEHV